MATDYIRYDILAQEAMRGLVRTVLIDAAKNGLPGEHHFYILFRTGAEGVGMSPRMRAQYPEEMTVVLQHQFWDLKVTDDGFEVGLSFGGIPERLVVPFAAIKSFVDPSVQFGVQFEEIGANATSEDQKSSEKSKAGIEAGSETSARPPAEHRGASAAAEPAPTPANPPPEPDKPSGGAEVVRLDRFRKK